MGAHRQPAQDVFGADHRHGHGLGRAVERGHDHEAAGRHQPRGVLQEGRMIGNVLDHLHIQHQIERRLAMGQQFLGRAAAIVDVQALFGGVGAGGADIALGRIHAGDRKAQPGHRFAEQASAAADVQQAQALERTALGDVASEPQGRLVADEGQAHRIEPVQRLELALRVPPLRRHGGKARHFGGVDAGLGRGVIHGRVQTF